MLTVFVASLTRFFCKTGRPERCKTGDSIEPCATPDAIQSAGSHNNAAHSMAVIQRRMPHGRWPISWSVDSSWRQGRGWGVGATLVACCRRDSWHQRLGAATHRNAKHLPSVVCCTARFASWHAAQKSHVVRKFRFAEIVCVLRPVAAGR